MHTRFWQSIYLLFIVFSTLMVSLLDLLKQIYAKKLEDMIDIYIDVALILWLPLSFFVAAKVLTVSPHAGDGEGSSTPSGLLQDSIALLGCIHTWLILNSLMSALSGQSSNFSCTIPSPLLFVFCYGNQVILISSLLTIILYGLCLHACGIEERRWGYFQPVHSMVTIPLSLSMDFFQHIATFLERFRNERRSDTMVQRE
ncbi:hypothetical protein F5880DRAFT_1605818 [Lentinula raphanica]|nr:hypothetical protein F5880DRAFT_1605818 [Lentinula raphanica]